MRWQEWQRCPLHFPIQDFPTQILGGPNNFIWEGPGMDHVDLESWECWWLVVPGWLEVWLDSPGSHQTHLSTNLQLNIIAVGLRGWTLSLVFDPACYRIWTLILFVLYIRLCRTTHFPLNSHLRRQVVYEIALANWKNVLSVTNCEWFWQHIQCCSSVETHRSPIVTCWWSVYSEGIMTEINQGPEWPLRTFFKVPIIISFAVSVMMLGNCQLRE